MHIRLIDANGLGYTHHHGQPRRLDPQGRPMQALAGVLSFVKYQLQYQPDVLNVFLWDEKAVWRYALLPEYKSGRHRTFEQREARREYAAQQPLIEQALSALPVLQVRAAGAEADDLGWGLSRALERQGHLVTLYASDVDWMQGVSARVSWMDARSPHRVVTLESFAKLSGGFLRPQLVAPVKALVGDTSDDIPGVDQIGDKRALALLGKYSTLDALLAATEDFMEFSNEPTYAHALMRPDIVALVKRNLQLVDLALAPKIPLEAVQMDYAKGTELDLYEVFQEAGLTAYADQFKSWQALSAKEIPKAALLTIERSIQVMCQAAG